MNDKRFERFLAAVAALFIVWWLVHKRTSNSSGAYSPSMPYNVDPIDATYAANPGAFGPQTVNGNVDINVRGYNTLNQNYLPLFGFVGMAQGQVTQ